MKKPVNQSVKILVLGGTSDARQIASLLAEQGMGVIYSLAGVTRDPELPGTDLRVGGFGGADGLIQYLQRNAISVIVDATHAYALNISANAVKAAGFCGIPLLTFMRRPWEPKGGEHWISVASAVEAAAALPSGACALVTIGRQQIEPFLDRTDLTGLMRMIEAPACLVPAQWKVILQRPPFTLQSEVELMRGAGITHLVSKNAGGAMGVEKLDAAQTLKLPVIMIERPRKPAIFTVSSIELFEEFSKLIAEATHPEK